MNKVRREALKKLIKKIEGIQEDIEAVVGELENLRDEEDEYIDNMPDGIRESERGERAEEARDNMDGAVDELTAIDFESILEQITAAVEA